MEKYGGTRYNSVWDASTWLIIAVVMACFVATCILCGGIASAIICIIMLLFVLVTFRSIYYRIDGDKLVVYQFFIPTVYPIDKIREIKPTSSVLSAPATSLSQRLAITFTDRKVLKSTLPLVISPVRRQEFIGQLLAVNPAIETGKI